MVNFKYIASLNVANNKVGINSKIWCQNKLKFSNRGGNRIFKTSLLQIYQHYRQLVEIKNSNHLHHVQWINQIEIPNWQFILLNTRCPRKCSLLQTNIFLGHPVCTNSEGQGVTLLVSLKSRFHLLTYLITQLPSVQCSQGTLTVYNKSTVKSYHFPRHDESLGK